MCNKMEIFEIKTEYLLLVRETIITSLTEKAQFCDDTDIFILRNIQ